MDSDICNCQDKTNDGKLSDDTFSTFLKTEIQSDCLVGKTESEADRENTVFKQETLLNGSLKIKQEIKKEHIFDEDEASPEGYMDVSYSYDNHSHLGKLMNGETSYEYTNILDVKDESGNMINSHNCFDLSVADDDNKTRNIQNVNCSPLGLDYQDQETFTESSIMTQQKTTYKSPEKNFGTSSLSGNDVQGSFVFFK